MRRFITGTYSGVPTIQVEDTENSTRFNMYYIFIGMIIVISFIYYVFNHMNVFN